MVKFNPFAKKPAGPSKKELQEIKKRQKEEEDAEKRQSAIENILPWRLEQRVSMVLNPVKIPLIIIVGFLGCYIEGRLDTIVTSTWYGPIYRKGPSCYVHQVNGKIWNTSSLDSVGRFLNKTFHPISQWINASLQNSSKCNYTDGRNKCEFFDSSAYGLQVQFEEDYCGITDECMLGEGEENTNGRGVTRKIPFVPFALIWAIYKLVFLPVHPVDRISNALAGYPDPLPEPIFKLMTEPYFQQCTGVMNVVSMIGKVIRYSLLPNSLMLPLLTMQTHPKCPQYLFYDMDMYFGHVIYFWVIFDLLIAVGLFAAGKTVFNGQCIGTWKYRAYKTYWLISLITALTLFIVDFCMVCNWRFWRGIVILLRVAFSIDLGFDMAIDLVQALATITVIFDVFQLTIMILSFILPPIMRKVPCCSPWMKLLDGTDTIDYRPLLPGGGGGSKK